MAVPETELGRRERKSLRTRRQIVRAAVELVLEDGYERATITRIADRADLATRTVTTRFPSKEAIFLEGVDEAVQRVEHLLAGAEGDVVDRLRAWIGEMAEEAAGEPDDPEVRALRSKAIAEDPDLSARFVQHFDRAHRAVAAAVAKDTGVSEDAVGPQMIAAATIAMIRVVERLASQDDPEAATSLEQGFDVLRAALRPLLGKS
jgi:AcrR family transcriptional regulator